MIAMCPEVLLLVELLLVLCVGEGTASRKGLAVTRAVY